MPVRLLDNEMGDDQKVSDLPERIAKAQLIKTIDVKPVKVKSAMSVSDVDKLKADLEYNRTQLIEARATIAKLNLTIEELNKAVGGKIFYRVLP